jgi:hypothetical protein
MVKRETTIFLIYSLNIITNLNHYIQKEIYLKFKNLIRMTREIASN